MILYLNGCSFEKWLNLFENIHIPVPESWRTRTVEALVARLRKVARRRAVRPASAADKGGGIEPADGGNGPAVKPQRAVA